MPHLASLQPPPFEAIFRPALQTIGATPRPGLQDQLSRLFGQAAGFAPLPSDPTLRAAALSGPSNIIPTLTVEEEDRLRDLRNAIDASRGARGRGPSGTAQIFSGAAQGAAAGTAVFPGVGTAVGAGVGAIGGLVGGRGSRKAKERAAKKRRQARRVASEANLARLVREQTPVARGILAASGDIAKSEEEAARALAASGLQGSGLGELARFSAVAAPETRAVVQALLRAGGLQTDEVNRLIGAVIQPGNQNAQLIMQSLGSLIGVGALNRTPPFSGTTQTLPQAAGIPTFQPSFATPAIQIPPNISSQFQPPPPGLFG